MNTPPPPPPEATLISIARKAAGLSIADAVQATIADISIGRWSQIENGYEVKRGTIKPVRGRDETIAHMAYATGVSPHRLEEAGRPDAAEVLREILRRHAGEDGGLPAGLTLEGFTPQERRTAVEFIKALRRSAPSEPERRAGNGGA